MCIIYNICCLHVILEYFLKKMKMYADSGLLNKYIWSYPRNVRNGWHLVALEQLFGQFAGFYRILSSVFFFSLFRVVLHNREHVPLMRAWAQNSLARQGGTEAAIQSDRAHCCVLVTCRIFILLAKMLGWSSMQDQPLHIWWHFFNCVLSEMKEKWIRMERTFSS